MADAKRLSRGDPDGAAWRPAEVDVSIRKGWFFHANEQPKTLRQLLDIYYNSVGNGCCLLLNVPPDRRGLFHEDDVKRLLELKAVLDDSFKTDLARGKTAAASSVRGNAEAFSARLATDGDRSTYWAADDAVREATLAVDFGAPARFNRIRLQEHLPLGQRIASFSVEARDAQGWKEIASGKTIGARRLLRFPAVTAEGVRLVIREALACPTLSTFEAYMAAAEEPLAK